MREIIKKSAKLVFYANMSKILFILIYHTKNKMQGS